MIWHFIFHHRDHALLELDREGGRKPGKADLVCLVRPGSEALPGWQFVPIGDVLLIMKNTDEEGAKSTLQPPLRRC